MPEHDAVMEVLHRFLDWSRSPLLVLTDPRSGHVPDWLEDLLTLEAPDAEKLETLYRRAGRRAYERGNRGMYIRALLAEASIEFDRTGVTPVEPLYYVAMQYRLTPSPVVARYWVSVLLSRQDVPLRYQVRLWRELAALYEIAGHYDRGLACTERSLNLCAEHPEDEATQAVAFQSHLQRSVLLRLSGRYTAARSAIADARRVAGPSPSSNTLALIELRTAGLDLIIGHIDDATHEYARAAQLFEGFSLNNRRYALLRQVTCLRIQGRLNKAADLGYELLDEMTENSYRKGQVLLELAEIEIARRNKTDLMQLIKRAAPLLSAGESLESLRWRTLVARSVVIFGEKDLDTVRRARANLSEVLRIASKSERNDTTRILYALHALAELESSIGSDEESLCAIRAAVLAAEIQRASITGDRDRWQMKRSRESVYALAALFHNRDGRHADVATVLELGKADVIEQALNGRKSRLTDIGGASDSHAGVQLELANALPRLIDPLRASENRVVSMPPLPGAARPSNNFDFSLLVGLTKVEGVWTSIRVLGSSTVTWTSSTVAASSRVCALLDRLTEVLSPDLCGVSNITWEELGQFLIPQELIDLGAGSLLISPDPRLWCIPWPALPYRERYLVDIGPLVLTPSLLSHGALVRRVSATLFGERECKMYLDDTLCGSRLEREALRKWSELPGTRPGLLYIAGHADSPESGLGTEKIDIDTLSEGHLPEIVVLNGCWTGATRPVYGRDPFSLAVGSLVGGARQAIAGCGSIGSEASAYVGVELLQRLSEGHDAASALRLAQITVRERYPEVGPMDWGGLMTIG